ncbi:hypothetical protein ILUMI_20245 [Ignelater luminosus]|uniref:Uncharacterized protein n=1 Tax=Ignelater luminosus TaxID=2038154 RepID=A0A8K0G523_IGNLU|nr:hypothetical protein ILUMI_20245 [Ignelater luminosus]
MVDEKQVSETPKEILEGNESDGNTLPIFLLLLVVPLLIVSCTLLYVYTSYQAKPDNNITFPVITSSADTIVNKQDVNDTRDITAFSRKHIQVQPHCTIKEYFDEKLKEISEELYIKKQLCTLNDFHSDEKNDVPNLASTNHKVPEPRGHFVIYIAVGLLLTSLVAAFVDVYKVKGKPSKTKPQLTKRCSLADLTVLRHSRRESMRKDSIADEQRGPLKLLDRSPM